MKLFNILLSGLIVASSIVLSASSHSVYYEEFKSLKKAPSTKGLFDQDLDGGSHTTQCNLDMYRPLFFKNDGDLVFFTNLDETRKVWSLGSIQRDIEIGKNLSFLNHCLQIGLSGIEDLVIVTPETMPALYNYVDVLSKKARISTPVVFVSLKDDFFRAFSRKVLMFTGSVVIGQQLLHDLSDEELEALVAQEIGHIKYHHSNKKFLLEVALGGALCAALKGDMGPYNNRLISWFVIPALAALFVGKRFEKQVDMFACKHAGKIEGLVMLLKRLQERDQARTAEFSTTRTMLADNAADLPMLTYLCLMIEYYLVKAEHCLVKVYNKCAYSTYQERIDAANDCSLQKK